MAQPKKTEERCYGRNACRALFARRPDDVIRVWIRKDVMPAFRTLLKWCAKNKRAYHIVDDEELARVTRSTHHEGICLLVRSTPAPAAYAAARRLAESDRSCALYLDGIANPHNVGSLVRTAANFGVQTIFGAADTLPSATGSLARVAEGGLEHLQLVAAEEPPALLTSLEQAGFKIYGTSSRAEESLYAHKLPKKVVFVLGNETQGVSKAIARRCHMLLRIPGTGAVESLNVAVAGALLLGEYYRQHGSGK